MVLINNHGAALMSLSQAHAKPNKKGILGTLAEDYRELKLLGLCR